MEPGPPGKGIGASGFGARPPGKGIRANGFSARPREKVSELLVLEPTPEKGLSLYLANNPLEKVSELLVLEPGPGKRSEPVSCKQSPGKGIGADSVEARPWEKGRSLYLAKNPQEKVSELI